MQKDNFDILTLIYEFVQENYEKEINLQLLSEKYHFSYSYLSAIFTEKFGINFSKYLKKSVSVKPSSFDGNTAYFDGNL